MVLILVRDGNLVSPDFREPYSVLLSDLFMVCNLLKPFDLRLMVNELDTLI